MTTTVHQLSDLTGGLHRVAEAIDHDGEARIERPGGGQLVLTVGRRYDAAVDRVEMLTSLFVYLRLTGSIRSAVAETLPWTRALSADHWDDFFTEVVSTFRRYHGLDVWEPLERLFIK